MAIFLYFLERGGIAWVYASHIHNLIGRDYGCAGFAYVTLIVEIDIVEIVVRFEARAWLPAEAGAHGQPGPLLE